MDILAFCDDEESSDPFYLPGNESNRALCSPTSINQATKPVHPTVQSQRAPYSNQKISDCREIASHKDITESQNSIVDGSFSNNSCCMDILAFCDDEESSDPCALPGNESNRAFCSTTSIKQATKPVHPTVQSQRAPYSNQKFSNCRHIASHKDITESQNSIKDGSFSNNSCCMDIRAFCDDEESSDFFALPGNESNRAFCSPNSMNHPQTVKKRKRSTSNRMRVEKFDITTFYDLEAGCADKEREHCSMESENDELNNFINDDNLEQVPELTYYRRVKRRRRN